MASQKSSQSPKIFNNSTPLISIAESTSLQNDQVDSNISMSVSEPEPEPIKKYPQFFPPDLLHGINSQQAPRQVPRQVPRQIPQQVPRQVQQSMSIRSKYQNRFNWNMGFR